MDVLSQLSVHTNFGVQDWAIVVVFLVVSTALGLYAKKYIRQVDDYVVAGRAVKTYLGVASIIASELGLVTVMYSSQKGFTGGFAAFHIAALSAIVSLIVGLTGFVVVPLRRMGVMTIPEFYERRYSRTVRLLGGTILAFSGILNMGMFLKADSMFVTSVMGMNDPATLKIAMTILLGLVLIYTMLGGMVAVLITDYMQFVIMAAGLIVTSLFLQHHYGWNHIVQTVQQLKGEAGFNPLSQEGFGIGYVVWMAFLGLVGCAFWQTSVMRASSAEDEKVVRRTFSWGAVGFLMRFMIPYFWGICALVFLSQHPALKEVFFGAQFDALTNSEKSNLTLRAMPIALSNLMPAGWIGLLTAGMLAAAMSTYNTYLHTWSAVLTQDVVASLRGGRLTHQQRILIARVLMFLIGLFLLVWGLWYPLGEDLWDYMAVTGAIYFTGAASVLVGGIYWKRASRAGAVAAFACGFLAVAGLSPVQQLLGFRIGSEWVGLGTVAAAALALVIFSLLFPDRPKTLEEA